MLGACATANSPENIAASYGLSVAAEVNVARPRDEVARCLNERENSASYPMGIAPGFTATERYGDSVYVSQWFYLKRGMQWTTRFALHPIGDAATQVQVLLPVELSLSDHYLRAALEVIARCQPTSVSAK